ncbi:hypothetical protein [Pectobacterium quasiaquaticum]|nr:MULTISPECIES: hypothetical protein [Pectobacterium]
MTWSLGQSIPLPLNAPRPTLLASVVHFSLPAPPFQSYCPA